jgi:hypothetical protein
VKRNLVPLAFPALRQTNTSMCPSPPWCEWRFSGTQAHYKS